MDQKKLATFLKYFSSRKFEVRTNELASESSKKALKIERRESYNHICIEISGIIPKLSTFVKTWSSLRTFIIDANEGRLDVIANLGFDQINETKKVLERQYDVMKILANN